MSDPNENPGSPGARFRHEPVMLEEIVNVFAEVPPGWLVDATLGGAGHARRLLNERPDCRLLGLDRDLEALVAARSVLDPFGDRVVTRHVRFDLLETVMAALAIDHVSGFGQPMPQIGQPIPQEVGRPIQPEPEAAPAGDPKPGPTT